MPYPKTLASTLTAVSLFLGLANAHADQQPERTDFTVDYDRSVIAFVTYKAGALSGLLDNVFTHPVEYTADVQAGPATTDARFTLQIATKSLTVNDLDVLERWYPTLHDLNIVDRPIDEMSAARRRRTLKHMLSEKQLNAEAYPHITAVVTRIVQADPPTDTDYRLHLDVTIRDRTVAVEWPATIERSPTLVKVETHGAVAFSSFGIEPFSRLFGAMRYDDELHVFGHIEAHAAAAPAEGEAP